MFEKLFCGKRRYSKSELAPSTISGLPVRSHGRSLEKGKGVWQCVPANEDGSISLVNVAVPAIVLSIASPADLICSRQELLIVRCNVMRRIWTGYE